MTGSVVSVPMRFLLLPALAAFAACGRAETPADRGGGPVSTPGPKRTAPPAVLAPGEPGPEAVSEKPAVPLPPGVEIRPSPALPPPGPGEVEEAARLQKELRGLFADPKKKRPLEAAGGVSPPPMRSEVIEELIRNLSIPEPKAAEAAHAALRRLTGQELPPDPAAWKAWWEKEKK